MINHIILNNVLEFLLNYLSYFPIYIIEKYLEWGCQNENRSECYQY